MNDRMKQVGFSQRVRLEWFEQTANLILAGNDRATITEVLRSNLRDKFTEDGQIPSGNRDKVITILLKTWLNAPVELHALQTDGLKIIGQLLRNYHIAVHWGMIMAVYPFWGAVAAQTGRLLRLQDTVSAAHVQRRIREQYGERETVERAARRILRSFIDWDVLQDTSKKGIYARARRISVREPELITWLVEASLHAHTNGAAHSKEVVDGPVMFPFRFEHLSAEQLVSLSPRLDILRHSLDDDLIMLRKE